MRPTKPRMCETSVAVGIVCAPTRRAPGRRAAPPGARGAGTPSRRSMFVFTMTGVNGSLLSFASADLRRDLRRRHARGARELCRDDEQLCRPARRPGTTAAQKIGSFFDELLAVAVVDQPAAGQDRYRAQAVVLGARAVRARAARSACARAAAPARRRAATMSNLSSQKRLLEQLDGAQLPRFRDASGDCWWKVDACFLRVRARPCVQSGR